MPYLTTRKNLKRQLSHGLVASYDIEPGNGVGLFWDTHTPDPHVKHRPQNNSFEVNMGYRTRPTDLASSDNLSVQ